MPYTFTHFVANVRATIKMYQELGVIPKEGQGPLRDLVVCVDGEFERLKERIVGWRATEKTPAQQKEHNRMFSDGQGRQDPMIALEKANAETQSLHKKPKGKGAAARRDTLILSHGQILPTNDTQNNLGDWEEGFGEEEDISAQDTTVEVSPGQRVSSSTMEARGNRFLESWSQVCILMQRPSCVVACRSESSTSILHSAYHAHADASLLGTADER